MKTMVRKYGLWMIVQILSFSTLTANGDVLEHLGFCCKEGVSWSENHRHCNNSEHAIDRIPAEWRGLCLSAFSVCCKKEYNNYQCVSGREAAKSGSDCEGTKNFNTTVYRSCCMSCQVGLAVAASEQNCSSHIHTYLEKDESFQICCNEDTAAHTFTLDENDDICEKFSNLCSHMCENTDDSYICKCPAGYILNDDRTTCSSLDDIDSFEDENENENPSHVLPASEGCTEGWSKNSLTGECEDIDECVIGLAYCKTDQHCHNTEGSYRCLDIKSTVCQHGFRFNTNTEECEDINECLEDLHNCSKRDQICLNIRGGFECQNKTTTDCISGFYFDVVSRKCEDYDECLDNPCDDGYECVNLPGKYECNGLAAVEYSNCGPGYRFKHNRCIDIDECATEKPCKFSEVCVNEEGGYKCDCKIGFKHDATTGECKDINECQINNHNCLPSQRCDNTIGSYSCIRLQGCGTGYTLNAETGKCDDDDECDLGTHNCPSNYQCHNTMGSFRCRLTTTTKSTTTTTTTTTTSTTTTTTTTKKPYVRPTVPAYVPPTTTNRTYYVPLTVASPTYYPRPSSEYTGTTTPRVPIYNKPNLPCGFGFQRNRHGACVDIDECRIPYSCGAHQRCINTNGSYRCQNLIECPGGYRSTPDGTTCADIDECTTGEHTCNPDQICRNKMGGYTCSCPVGHMENQYKRCEDIDECSYRHEQVCPTNSVCANTQGSYRCDCKTGFKKLNPTDKNCVDIDECQEIENLCEHKCSNYWSSYRCTCNRGYELSSDNHTCVDIDECEVYNTYKPCVSQCHNTPGSYECSCPPGYKLVDKASCQDINECERSDVCTGPNEICTNIRGSYRCNTIDCPYGYAHDPNKKNRCKNIDPYCNGEECYMKPFLYTYNFITFVSKLQIPPEGREFFSLRGPPFYEKFDFDLKIARIQAPPNVEKASEQHFAMTKENSNEVKLSLMRTLEGPQDIELEIGMTVFMNGQPTGRNVAKVFITVSQYTF